MSGLTVHPSTSSGRTVKPCTVSRLKLITHLDKPQHVLVTFTHSGDEALSGLALSETSLATDWLNDEEDTAWSHLQAVK
jgi:hypothetical protein